MGVSLEAYVTSDHEQKRATVGAVESSVGSKIAADLLRVLKIAPFKSTSPLNGVELEWMKWSDIGADGPRSELMSHAGLNCSHDTGAT